MKNVKEVSRESIIKIIELFDNIEIRVITQVNDREISAQGLFLTGQTFNRLAEEMIKFVESYKKGE